MTKTILAILLGLAFLIPLGIASADHTTPGEAGMTKVNIYDNTHNGWNVNTNDPVTGTPDPVIGFVNFRPTVSGDPNNIIVTVSLKDGAPNCTYTIEAVLMGSNPNGGLAPEGFHQGWINQIGTLTTNGNGKGNSGAIIVDTTTLSNTAPSGSFTYAHIDVEDYAGTCVESDGTPVFGNEYAGTSFDPAIPGTIMHWAQP